MRVVSIDSPAVSCGQNRRHAAWPASSCRSRAGRASGYCACRRRRSTIARLAISWPRTSAKSTSYFESSSNQLVEPRRRRLDLDRAGEEADGLGQAGDGDHFDPFDHGRFGRAFGRHDQPAQARLLAPRPWPSTGALASAASLPSSASSPTTAYCSNSSDASLPAAGQHAQRDRQIERRRLLGQLGRGQVDDDPVVAAAGSRS